MSALDFALSVISKLFISLTTAVPPTRNPSMTSSTAELLATCPSRSLGFWNSSVRAASCAAGRHALRRSWRSWSKLLREAPEKGSTQPTCQVGSKKSIWGDPPKKGVPCQLAGEHIKNKTPRCQCCILHSTPSCIDFPAQSSLLNLSQGTNMLLQRSTRTLQKGTYRGWTKSCTIVCWYLQRNHHSRISERRCEMDFVHPQ